jgi:hypothetical protein
MSRFSVASTLVRPVDVVINGFCSTTAITIFVLGGVAFALDQYKTILTIQSILDLIQLDPIIVYSVNKVELISPANTNVIYALTEKYSYLGFSQDDFDKIVKYCVLTHKTNFLNFEISHLELTENYLRIVKILSD